MFATKQPLQQGNRSKPRFRLPESRPSSGVIQRCSPEEVKREAFTIYEKRKDKAPGYNADGDYFLAQSILRARHRMQQAGAAAKPDHLSEFQSQMQGDNVTLVYGTEPDRMKQRILGIQDTWSRESLLILMALCEAAPEPPKSYAFGQLTSILNDNTQKSVLPEGFVRKSTGNPVGTATSGPFTVDRFNNYSWRDFIDQQDPGDRLYSIYNPSYNHNFQKPKDAIKQDLESWTSHLSIDQKEKPMISDYQKNLLDDPSYSPLITYEENPALGRLKEEKEIKDENGINIMKTRAKNCFELETRRACKFGLKYAYRMQHERTRVSDYKVAFLIPTGYDSAFAIKKEKRGGPSPRIPITTSEIRKLFRLNRRSGFNGFQFYNDSGSKTAAPWEGSERGKWDQLEFDNLILYRALAKQCGITTVEAKAYEIWEQRRNRGEQGADMEQENYLNALSQMRPRPEDMGAATEKRAYSLWEEKGRPDQNEDSKRADFENAQRSLLEGDTVAKLKRDVIGQAKSNDTQDEIAARLCKIILNKRLADSASKEGLTGEVTHQTGGHTTTVIYPQETVYYNFLKNLNGLTEAGICSEVAKQDTPSVLIWLLCMKYLDQNVCDLAGQSPGLLKKKVISQEKLHKK